MGKTTLARGYIEWLARTQGLPQRVIWQSFADVRSFDYVRNRLVEELFGTNAMALPDAKKWAMLLQALKQQAVLIVWDNFESASGTADAGLQEASTDREAAQEAMPGADRQELKRFLEQLRGSKTKVLITSRSDEEWLGTTACFRIALSGLQGEERLALVRSILDDQGIALDPKDQHTADLIDSLQGHPLMMRAILPRLKHTSARNLQQDIRQYVPQADSTDEVERRLYATLRYVEEGLPAELKPLLYPIGLHAGYVDADDLAAMAQAAGQPFQVQHAQRTLELLETAGLVRGLGNNIFELHPALGRYLRARAQQFISGPEQAARWRQSFVDFMAQLAQYFAGKQPHEQRPVFDLHGANFERAQKLAEERQEFALTDALLQARASYAMNRRNLPLAKARFETLAQLCEAHAREDRAAGAYHQLGIVAQERRDFTAAEAWYRKSLPIEERQGNKHGAAISYHQLGRVASDI